MIDEKKLQQFLGKMIADFGAAMSVPFVGSVYVLVSTRQ